VTAVGLVAAACHTPTLADVLECTTVPATGISMHAPDSTLRVGSTVQITASPVTARSGDQYCVPSVGFESGDPGVAIVSSAGLVTGMSAGTAYIRAISGTVRDSLPIKVVAAAVASLDTR
jgi:uncharacterized protein YjdB